VAVYKVDPQTKELWHLHEKEKKKTWIGEINESFIFQGREIGVENSAQYS